MSVIYSNGYGVNADQELGMAWFKKAKSHGSKDAAIKTAKINESVQIKKAIKSYNTGIRSLRERDFVLPEEFLRIAIKNSPDSIEAYSSLGASFGMQNKFKESIRLLQKAISIDPKNPDVHANIGYSYSKIGDWKGAIKHYRITLDIDPSHERARYNLKQALRRESK